MADPKPIEFDEDGNMLPGQQYPGSERFGVTLADVAIIEAGEMIEFDPNANGPERIDA